MDLSGFRFLPPLKVQVIDLKESWQMAQVFDLKESCQSTAEK